MILMNLIVIKEKKQDSEINLNSKKVNISDNPKCLLMLRKGKKISRNEKCEATGKKYKQCCGALR